jgi:hypothetical protein
MRCGGRARARPSSCTLTQVNRRAFIVALMAATGATACHPQRPLANTYVSAEALAAAVLEALEAGDRARLQSLAITEQEFHDHVWAELPAARPERNLPWSYVWRDLHQKSELSLSATLTQQRGQHVVIERVTFADVTQYASYRVHRTPTLQVRDASGARLPLRVCGSMLEKNGAWKIFSYVVDP